MKVNGCARCGQLVFFENTACLRCGAPLGFEPDRGRVLTLVPDSSPTVGGVDHDDAHRPATEFFELPPVAEVAAGLGDGPATGGPAGPQPLAAPRAGAGTDPIARDVLEAVPVSRRRRYRRCANARLAGCNWLIPVPARAAHPAPSGELCVCCRLTRTRPADTDSVGKEQFERAEAAKRRLVAQLLELGLPVVSHADDPATGLAFDLLSSTKQKVMTGHSDGVITLDLAESDDAHRETVRTQLGEPYRTLLGHFRHETGHYYWSSLVDADSGRAARFRDLFGDADLDYSAALDRHYADGPPPNWRESHVSAYATMHPWEDWAETFAHYLHIRDTLRTAAEFGLQVAGPDLDSFGVAPRSLAAVPADLSPPRADGLDRGSPEPAEIIAQWLPLTYALNAINRSMGRDDLYPFVLTPAVQAKLSFVHDVIAAARPEPGAAAAASGRTS
ncbi:putative zinc-binding peptidase [Frankia sp. AiPs1]|uniref:zinc-binding metallopeptidase family protein n=1 Tax=Frankia sp. AiPs1 TaxID=573493 RepID=UPI002043F25B|nr:putative zinc-binding metallopeptidase [Frankia sp. AiPs1]MCM3922191.1 putative zinc-binding peptidase [Frankia sp. AiPs1]